MANPPIPGVATFPAHQLAESALRSHDPITGRLLEQTPGDVFHIRVCAQVRTIQKPLGHTHRKALGRDNSGRFGRAGKKL
jgi:hypothetical protein